MKRTLALALCIIPLASRAADDIKVTEAVGQAALFDDQLAAKAAAKDDALRNCVQQVATTIVSASTETDQAQLLSDKIYAHSAGYVRKYTVLEDKQDGSAWMVKLRCEVSEAKLDDDMMAFGIAYRRVESPEAWHPEVEVFDVREGERALGRIWLDMHPREGKYRHFAQFTRVNGQAGRRLPEGVLVCNFPRPGAEPALLAVVGDEAGHRVDQADLDRRGLGAEQARRAEQELLALSRAVRKTVDEEYAKGATSLLDYLDTQRSRIRNEVEYLGIVQDFWSAVFQVERAVGTTYLP